MEGEKAIHQQFQEAIRHWTRNKEWLAKEMFLSVTHFSLIINGKTPMTEENRKKLNELLGTRIGEKIEENG